MAERILSPTERRLALLSVIGAISVVGMQIGLFMPLLSLVLEAKGVSPFLIGLNAAFGSSAVAIFAPFVPAVVRRLGSARFMLGCFVLAVACVLLLRIFDNVWAWFPIRFAFNMGIVGLFIASEAWIGALADERSRGRIVGLYAACLGGGFALGPALLSVTGSAGWPPFLSGAAIMAAGSLPLLAAWRFAPVMPGRAAFSALGFLRVAPTLALAVLVFGLIETTAYSLLAIQGMRLGQSEVFATRALSLFAVGAIILQLPIGWLADRINRYLVLILCAAATLAGPLALPHLSEAPIAWLAVIFLWGGLATGLYTVALTIVGERFRGADLVAANAALGMLYGLGAMIGPALGGAAMQLWPGRGLMGTLALAAFLVLATALLRRSWQHAGGQKMP
ncbi:MAG: MFS transporter [Alphaproteobacteria bacterium]|nr:MFS transporter [Alphaproteobacteria bacterium]